jgi:CRP-like cAMP-binding protein
VAETEVVALRLTSSAFDGIMAEQPALAAKILRNLTLQLANRVRVLTGDLAQWVERSAHGRSANEPAMSLVAPVPEDGRD